MGNKASAPAAPASGGECKKSDKVGIKSGKKICCCCPETKKARDECVVFKGEGESSSRAEREMELEDFLLLCGVGTGVASLFAFVGIITPSQMFELAKTTPSLSFLQALFMP